VTVAPEAAQDAGEILENALAALVGRTATWIVEGAPPTFEEALAEYSNAELADTAGLEGGPVGSDARRERRTFMRSLQRYRNYLAGTGKESRRPSEASRIRLADLGRRRREREATPDGAGAVARLIRRHGYRGTPRTLQAVAEDAELRDNLAAAAHLSCIDYLGDAQWDESETAKTWYARMKSRPSFRPLLAERLPGMTPSVAYADLDF